MLFFPPAARTLISAALGGATTTITTAGAALISLGARAFGATFWLAWGFFSNENIAPQTTIQLSLVDFIETPSQNYSQEVLKAGVAEVVSVLRKDSHQIIGIILSNQFIPSIYLLYDLAVKMKSQGSLPQLSLLYDQHLDVLVNFVWNWHDLKRLVESQPSYLEKIMGGLKDNQECIQRLLNDADNVEVFIEYIKELEPDYKFPEQLAYLVPSGAINSEGSFNFS